MNYDITFTKAVASGNDFIIIDNISREFDAKELDYSAMAKDLCRRKISIGADGILALEASSCADFKMRIINPDGSEVDMCGNGARCSVLYAQQRGLGDSLTFETGAGVLEGAVSGANVKIKMTDPKDVRLGINLGLGPNLVTAHYINTGVAHVVCMVEDLENFPIVEVGRKIRQHSMFAPEGANANFISKVQDNKGLVRTYERGVEDETLACGTGTVASAVVSGLLGEATSPVEMTTKSGEVLKVYFNIAGKDKITDVYLEGEAKTVCEGKV